MSDYDHGPLQAWEITWRSGHVETVEGHQVIFESMGFVPCERPRMMIHGQFDGHWWLVLAVPEEEIVSARLVTKSEEIPQ